MSYAPSESPEVTVSVGVAPPEWPLWLLGIGVAVLGGAGIYYVAKKKGK